MSSLMEFLQNNRDNRGVLAALRQGLVPTTEMRAWPWLVRHGGVGTEQRAQAVRTVAGLFAHHPEACATGSMGTTCRALCSPDEKPWESVDATGKAIAPGPMARRLGYLLAADAGEICERVARVVLYAKSKDIPINYAQLEKDLAQWPRYGVRERWASDFWAAQTTEDAAGESGVQEGGQ